MSLVLTFIYKKYIPVFVKRNASKFATFFWNKTNIFLQPRVNYLFSLLGLPITFATIVFSIARICRKSKEMSVTWQKL